MVKEITKEQLKQIEKNIAKDINPRVKHVTDKFQSPILAMKKIITTNKYNDEEKLQEKVLEYFNMCQGQNYEVDTGRGLQFFCKTPTFKELKLFLGVNNTELTRIRKQYPDTVEWINDMIEQIILSNATTGKANNVMSMFNLKNNHGYSDQLPENSQKEVIINIGSQKSIEKPAQTYQSPDELAKALAISGLDINKAEKKLGEN